MAKKPKRRPRLSPAERAARIVKRQHIKFARDVFKGAGFNRIPEMSDKEFEFGAAKSDFDDVFICENVIVFLEYTTSGEEHVADHLRKNTLYIENFHLGPKSF